VHFHGPPQPGIWWFDVADMVANLAGLRIGGPALVRSPLPPPPGASALFGCPIEPHTTFAVRLDRAVLDHPMPPVDPAVRALVERQIRQLAVTPTPPAAIVAHVWALGPTATLSRLAEAVGCSERTVHRRLAEAGTTFRAELDAVRAHVARNAGGRPADEVAELLGYSDARACRRAARRWVGRT
jgi:AraC-like DNA-binding protein